MEGGGPHIWTEITFTPRINTSPRDFSTVMSSPGRSTTMSHSTHFPTGKGRKILLDPLCDHLFCMHQDDVHMSIVGQKLSNETAPIHYGNATTQIPINELHSDNVVDVVQHPRCLGSQCILCKYHCNSGRSGECNEQIYTSLLCVIPRIRRRGDWTTRWRAMRVHKFALLFCMLVGLGFILEFS